MNRDLFLVLFGAFVASGWWTTATFGFHPSWVIPTILASIALIGFVFFKTIDNWEKWK